MQAAAKKEPLKRNDVLHFIMACINDCEAGGFRAIEDANDDGDPIPTPTTWLHDDESKMTFAFGDEVFNVTVSKARKE